MPDKFQAYATGLQRSHRALLRNLDVLLRVLLGWIGERRFTPLRRYAYTKELAL